MSQDIAGILINERANHRPRSLYDWTQINFAYHNNRIEGSMLSLDQTAQLYRATAFNHDSNDIIEMQNHFHLFDYVLDTIDEPLTLDYIKKLHGILKQGTISRWGTQEVIGDFKQKNNVIGQLQTVNTFPADQVLDQLAHLLKLWNKQRQTELSNYAAFHYGFERIHPFSDGNGRIGRMLLFKERCRNRVMPFIIADEDRPFYIRGLREFKRMPGYLIDTFGNAMDQYSYAFEQVYGNYLQKQRNQNKPKQPRR